MEKALTLLVEEHDVISQAGEVIKRINRLWESDSSQYTAKVRELIEFFRKYSDSFHHAKEEGILFPAMLNHPGFSQHDLIMELEEHHVMFRENVRAIENYLEEEKYAEAQKILVKYLEDLLDHIAAENEELFPMAQNIFSTSELENLYFRFIDADIEMGEEEKKRLSRIVV